MMSYRVAVVGATGAVGTVMRAKLRERGFPATEIVPFASERSAGKRARRRDRPAARATRRSRASTSRIFSAGGATSGEWAPRFVEAGAVVVDNSSQVAPRPRGPARRLRGQPATRSSDHKGLIANPNCSTMQLMVALKPIHDAAGIERLIVSTYQSVSGTGVKAVEELEEPDARRAARRGAARRRRSTRTRSRSTCSAAPATSPTATTTPTKSAR